MSEALTDCFAAVALPARYHNPYRSLAQELNETDDRIVPRPSSLPHITIAFLDIPTRSHLKRAVAALKKRAYDWRNTQLSVGGFGVFNETIPQLVYLAVNPADTLLEMRRFMQEHPDIFHPRQAYQHDLHVSLASVTRRGREKFDEIRPCLEERLGQESWRFSPKELAIFGVNGENQRKKLAAVSLR